MFNFVMKWRYCVSAGGYRRSVDLTIEDSTFTLISEWHTMWSNGPQKRTFEGTVINKGNNYYYLTVNKFENTPIKDLHLELVTLSSKQSIEPPDPIAESMMICNAGRFNNDEWEFDAILMYNPSSVNEYTISEKEELHQCVTVLNFKKLLSQ